MTAIPIDQLPAAMDALASRLETASLAEALESVVPIIREGFARNFTALAGSEGEGWPARKIEGDRHPLLVDTGALRGATQGGAGGVKTVGERDLAVGVEPGGGAGGLPFAAIHNFGYPAGNVPQREFIYASEETLDAAVEAFADRVTETIFGGG